MQIGKYNILKVARGTDFGLYLADEEGNEVLLPKKYTNEKMQPGTLGRVFVYKDSSDRIVATTQKPMATVDEAAYLVVKDVTRAGTFLEWGLEKDLMLPFAEQKLRPKVGDNVLVYIYLDRATERIVATTNINKFIKNNDVKYDTNQEVDVMICYDNEIGTRVIVENKYWGIIFKNEMFTPLEKGTHVKGYVKQVREDGKVDVALRKQGYEGAKDTTTLLLEKLELNNGLLRLSDNSAPEEIYAQLGISKKVFKKAVGILMKQGKVEPGDDFIKLKEKK
mgnify:CR=1 FL=1